MRAQRSPRRSCLRAVPRSCSSLRSRDPRLDFYQGRRSARTPDGRQVELAARRNTGCMSFFPLLVASDRQKISERLRKFIHSRSLPRANLLLRSGWLQRVWEPGGVMPTTQGTTFQLPVWFVTAKSSKRFLSGSNYSPAIAIPLTPCAIDDTSPSLLIPMAITPDRLPFKST